MASFHYGVEQTQLSLLCLERVDRAIWLNLIGSV